MEKRDIVSGIDAIEADEPRILESDVAIFAKDDVKRNDDVNARPATARNCPITGSSWHISRPVSHFPSVTSRLVLSSLFSFLFSYYARVCTRTSRPARREAQSQRKIKSINMWEAHATHSSVCSTRNNLRVSSSRASGRARAPEPRTKRGSGFAA